MVEKNRNGLVLLIEDDDVQIKLLENFLWKQNYQFASSQTLEKARQILKSSAPDVIVLDLNLPDGSGLDFLAELKSRPAFEQVPIVLISADGANETVVHGLGIGANDYLVKPFKLNEFMIRVKNLIELSRSKQRLQDIYNQLSSEKNTLERYFSKDLTEALFNKEISAEVGGEIVDAAIFFCDLRDSTTIAESVNANDFAVFLSEFFADIADIIYGNGGSIKNFRGDGFLAAFGIIGDKRNNEERAMRTALQIREHLRQYNSVRPDFLSNEVRMGMGIASGRVFAGNVGTVHRMDFTLLGDAVNLAARLESLTKFVGVDVLVDGSVRDNTREIIKYKKVRIENIRGKIKKVRIYYPDSLKSQNKPIDFF